MNKKLLITLSSIGVAAGFWACGGGTIEPMDDADGYVKAMLDSQDGSGLTFDVGDAVEKCEADFGCKGEMDRAQDTPITSSEPPAPESSSGPAPQSSSSSRNFFPTSSIGPIGGESSSSSAIAPPQSSSEIGPVVNPGDLGSCAPSASIVELGANVTWSFTWASGTASSQKLGAKFAWTFDGGSPAVGSARESVTSYSTSGDKVAKLTVTAGDGVSTQDLTCSVHVNGQPITGCKCVGTNTSPDVAAGESASWSVTGCTTKAPATLTGYVWKGATADASGENATAPVAAKGDVVSGVSVTAMNDDESQMTVQCEAATAIDSRIPDYVIDAPNGTVTIPAGSDVSVQMGATNPAGCQLYCKQADGLATNLTIGGKTFTCSGGCHHMDLNSVVTTASCTGSLSIKTNTEITCGANWW